MAQGLACPPGLARAEPPAWGFADEGPDAALALLDRLKRKAMDSFGGDGWSPVHAAAAEVDGRLVIIPGAPGSGKSTLSAVLARRGHAVADDLVFLREARGTVEALVPPLPLTVLEASLNGLPQAASWRLGPGRLPNDKILLRPPAVLSGVGEVAAVVLLQRKRSRAGVSLRPVSRGEAARCLLQNIVRYSNGGPAYAARRRRAWRVLCTLLDGVPAYALCGDLFSKGDAAAEEIERVLEGGRHV